MKVMMVDIRHSAESSLRKRGEIRLVHLDLTSSTNLVTLRRGSKDPKCGT